MEIILFTQFYRRTYDFKTQHFFLKNKEKQVKWIKRGTCFQQFVNNLLKTGYQYNPEVDKSVEKRLIPII